ncbi:Rab family GTPase [Rhodocaloribacter sp.]
MMKKICMLGASAVGKTSLVKRFVEGIFSERYLTTVGVKIDKKRVRVGDRSLDLVLWDLNGEDRFQKLSMSYMRGAAGYLLVVDGTRRETLDTAMVLHHKVRAVLGETPFVMMFNKADLEEDWVFSDEDLRTQAARGWTVLKTSAKTGTGVEEAFLQLSARLLEP